MPVTGLSAGISSQDDLPLLQDTQDTAGTGSGLGASGHRGDSAARSRAVTDTQTL